MPVIRTLNKDSKYSRYKSNLRNSQKRTGGHNFWLLFGFVLVILAVLFVIFYPTIKENLFGKAFDFGDVHIAACSNSADDDGDGKIDYPTDPGCSSYTDDNEYNLVIAACSNSADDDGDGKIDYPTDFGCASSTDTTEYGSLYKCDNNLDDDSDTLIDFPDDPGCLAVNDNDEANAAALELCNVAGDEDLDTLSDCDDPDCSDNPACAPPPSETIDSDGDSTIGVPSGGESILSSFPSQIIELTSCGANLDQEGATYLLNQDVVYNEEIASECINIEASNIILDCQGYSIISANLVGDGIITDSRFNNIEIRNCKVSGFGKGVDINGNLNFILRNNLFQDNNLGIEIEGTSGYGPSSVSIIDTTSCGNSGRDVYCIGDSLTTQLVGSGNFIGTMNECYSDQLQEGVHYSDCPTASVTLCTDGQTINNCLCNAPGLEIVGDKCTSAVMKTRNALDHAWSLPQKITAIASALRTYFGLS